MNRKPLSDARVREIDVDRILRLVDNLATAAFGERCFDLGGDHRVWVHYSIEGYEYPEPWLPGAGLSADHSCQDCGVPLKSADAEQGMRTCEGCAGGREGMR